MMDMRIWTSLSATDLDRRHPDIDCMSGELRAMDKACPAAQSLVCRRTEAGISRIFRPTGGSSVAGIGAAPRTALTRVPKGPVSPTATNLATDSRKTASWPSGRWRVRDGVGATFSCISRWRRSCAEGPKMPVWNLLSVSHGLASAEIDSPIAAVRFMDELPTSRRNHMLFSVALNACRRAVSGEVTAEGARNVFETWARSAGLLLPNGDSRIATGTMPAEDGVVSG